MSKLPESTPEMINLPLAREELATLTNLMSMCAQTFEDLVRQALDQDNIGAAKILEARQKLCDIYAQKFLSCYKIGEPTSRDIH